LDRITDETGRVLTENFIVQVNQVTSFDISNLSSCIYFIEGAEDARVNRVRFVVED
jgi:hypothetical protein